MFVFGALLAYAVLLYKLYKMKTQTRRYKKKSQRGQDEDDGINPVVTAHIKRILARGVEKQPLSGVTFFHKYTGAHDQI